MNKIKTVIIPVAGKGTRFLPITKSIPKTMFPVVNKPVIQHLIEEALRANISNIIIVISKEQEMIKDYFDINSMYYKTLNKRTEEILELDKLVKTVNIKFIIQDNPRGLGDAIIKCKDYIIGDAFALMLGDDLVLSDELEYGISDLVKKYEMEEASYIGIKEVPLDKTYKYGIIKLMDNTNRIEYMVEKPKTNPPSRFAAVGRYIFKTNIFSYLEKINDDTKEEIMLTDAINILINEDKVYACLFKGERFDIGDHLGYILANIKYGFNDENIKKSVLEYIKD